MGSRVEGEEILRRMSDVMKRVFGTDQLSVSRETRPDDVPGWDSMSHVLLLGAMESEFGVAFPVDKTYAIANLGDIADVIAGALENKAPREGR